MEGESKLSKTGHSDCSLAHTGGRCAEKARLSHAHIAANIPVITPQSWKKHLIQRNLGPLQT